MSIFDNSMAALKATLKTQQDLQTNLQARIADITNRIAPLNVQLNDSNAQLSNTQAEITNINSNIADLQKIIDADNAAVAAGQPPPSQEFINTYLR